MQTMMYASKGSTMALKPRKIPWTCVLQTQLGNGPSKNIRIINGLEKFRSQLKTNDFKCPFDRLEAFTFHSVEWLMSCVCKHEWQST